MRKSKIFVGLCVSFIAGVLVGSVAGIPKPWLFAVMAFCVAGFALNVTPTNHHQGVETRRPSFYVIFACLFFACVGAWRLQAIHGVPNEYASWFGQKQDFEGVISEDVDVRTDRQMITVTPDGFHQRVLVTLTKTNAYFYGQRVWLRGKVVEARGFDGFDYPGYLERFNTYALMRYPSAIVLREHQGNMLKEGMLRLKAAVVRRAGQVLAEPHGSLLMGILIGARKSLPEDVVANFIATGTSHIIAVSGYNVSVIVGVLGYLAYALGRRRTLWVGLAVIVGFTVIAGASASVVRAAVMGIVLLLAQTRGRLYAVTPALALAAAGMLFANPKILYWDVGFQLSFAATVGIVYGVPILEKLTQSWPKLWGLKTTMLVTVAAVAATLPLVLLHFGRLSVVALVVNVLILPFVPLVMLLGAFVVLPWVGAGVGYLLWFPLEYILRVTSWFARLPFASVEINVSPASILGVIIFIVSAYVLAYSYVRKKDASFRLRW